MDEGSNLVKKEASEHAVPVVEAVPYTEPPLAIYSYQSVDGGRNEEASLSTVEMTHSHDTPPDYGGTTGTVDWTPSEMQQHDASEAVEAIDSYRTNANQYAIAQILYFLFLVFIVNDWFLFVGIFAGFLGYYATSSSHQELRSELRMLTLHLNAYIWINYWLIVLNICFAFSYLFCALFQGEHDADAQVTTQEYWQIHQYIANFFFAVMNLCVLKITTKAATLYQKEIYFLQRRNYLPSRFFFRT